MSEPTNSSTTSDAANSAMIGAAVAAGNGASASGPTQPTNELGVPESLLEDWRWLFKAREDGTLDAYRGQHVAVVNKTVVASDSNPYRLQQILVEKFHLDPAAIVVAYVDLW